jgi:hypothetical protein
MPEITVEGEVFTVQPRYAEGHSLSEAEAHALNITLFNNIRNNMASRVRTAKKNGHYSFDAMQATLTNYVAAYEFGVKQPRPSKDPIRVEAVKLVIAKINELLVQQYGKGHGRSKQKMTEDANKFLDDPTKADKAAKYWSDAEAKVAATSDVAAQELEALIGEI